MSVKVKDYFDLHTHRHKYHRMPHYYDATMNYLKKLEPAKRKKILDFGCGDGYFIKKMIENGLEGEFYGSDLSPSMINLAKKEFRDKDVNLFVADGFKLPLKIDTNFDIIHIDGVLHHIIGKTRQESIAKVEKIIDKLTKTLSENGSLIVEEVDFVSYIFPSITSIFVFYFLKLFNFFNMDLSKISDEIRPGLEVNFFNDQQLKKLLEKYGNVQQIRKKMKKMKWKRLFLLKEQGNISYVVRIKPFVQ